MNSFIKKVQHQVKEPVRIEREEHDVIVIEGVRYDADYFRTMGAPERDVLYALRREDDGSVRFTLIQTIEEAEEFFNECGQGDSAPTEENENAL